MPSLKQLNEAIAAYRADHPDVLMTVVVDATFGHRIDTKEVAAFEAAIETNEFVAPPAGAVGRGDGFILSIAQKASASILSNDSYQEFHGEYAWLFDEGRLIGGKPVPHVGWVFVDRVPVRGPVSRRSVKEQKIVDKSPTRRRSSKRDADTPSISADGPMPVPTSLPPGAVPPGTRRAAKPEATRPEQPKQDSGRRNQGKQDRSRQEQGKQDQGKQEQARQEQGRQNAAKTTNDLLAFLSFVEHFPVGSAVTGVVESYSSHGAYVAIGDVHGYVPLRLMADPAPRSAREAMDLGETVTLVVSSFGAARRSIDLAVPSMAPVVAPPTPRARRGAKQAAAVADIEAAAMAAATPEETARIEAPRAAKASGARKRTPKQSVANAPTGARVEAGAAAEAPASAAPAKRSGGRRASGPATSAAAADVQPEAPVAERPAKPTQAAKPAKAARASKSSQATHSEAAKPVAPVAKRQAASRRSAASREAAPAAPAASVADATAAPAKSTARRRPAKQPAGS